MSKTGTRRGYGSGSGRGAVSFGPIWADTRAVSDSSGTVLVLEDEDNLREPLAHLLTLRHYHVIAVDNVEAALAALRTERVDAAIVDLHVKNQSGRDVIVRMPSKAPVIIFSGMGAASGDLARLRPRTRLVEKPASLTWVIDSLGEMLQRTRDFAQTQPRATESRGTEAPLRNAVSSSLPG